MPTIVSELSVALVDAGGNTGGGMYFYNFTPDILDITELDTTLTYAFREDIDPRFQIVDVFTTDSKSQVTQIQVASDQRSVSMIILNTQKQLILMSLLVFDSKTQVYVNCDPQVVCRPPVQS